MSHNLCMRRTRFMVYRLYVRHGALKALLSNASEYRRARLKSSKLWTRVGFNLGRPTSFRKLTPRLSHRSMRDASLYSDVQQKSQNPSSSDVLVPSYSLSWSISTSVVPQSPSKEERIPSFTLLVIVNFLNVRLSTEW